MFKCNDSRKQVISCATATSNATSIHVCIATCQHTHQVKLKLVMRKESHLGGNEVLQDITEELRISSLALCLVLKTSRIDPQTFLYTAPHTGGFQSMAQVHVLINYMEIHALLSGDSTSLTTKPRWIGIGSWPGNSCGYLSPTLFCKRMWKHPTYAVYLKGNLKLGGTELFQQCKKSMNHQRVYMRHGCSENQLRGHSLLDLQLETKTAPYRAVRS